MPPPFTRNETESGTTESSHEVPVKKHAGKECKKNGRKAKWSGVLDDMIDIVVNSEYYKRKRLFTKSKNRKKF